MPETQTIFEYVDDQGKTHRVNSMSMVPKRYYKTMLAIGADPAALKEEKKEPFDLGNYDLSTPVGVPVYIPIVAIIALLVAVKTKSFATRVISIALTACLAFYILFQWAETIGVFKTAERTPDKPTAEEENR